MNSFLDKLIRDIRLKKVSRFIPNNAILLDVGCGDPPLFLLRIKDKIKTGFGIDKDVEPKPINQRLELKKVDLDQKIFIPFPDNFFDIVTMIAVIEHLQEPIKVLRETKRVLKNEGKLILTTPPPLAKPILEMLSLLRLISQKSIKEHKHYFSKKDLSEMSKKLDFQKVLYQPFELGLNQLLIIKKK